MAKLRLRAREGLFYPHLGHQDAGRRSFVGARYKRFPGPAEDGTLDNFGFEQDLARVEEFDLDTLPMEHAVEYAKAVCDGDLLAADAATAAFCSKMTGRRVPHMGASAASDTPEEGEQKE